MNPRPEWRATFIACIVVLLIILVIIVLYNVPAK
jgi:hypothetical protein